MNEWTDRKMNLPPIPGGVGFDLRKGFVESDRLPGYDEVVEIPPLEHFTAAERHRAGVAGMIALALFVLFVLVLLAYVGAIDTGADDPSPVTPTTYGWPGPNGGFTSMPVGPR